MKMRLSSKQRISKFIKDIEGYHEGDSLFLSENIGLMRLLFDKKMKRSWI